MSGALDAIICIDTDGNITFWNPQAEVIFGWKEAEVMGQLLSALIVPEPFRKYHDEGMKHYLKTGEGKAINVLLELSALNSRGEEFPIELTVIPVKQGAELFFCAFIRDISQRKKAEHEKNSLQSTLENSLNEIFIFDADTLLYTYANKGAIQNLGYSEQEIKTLTPLDIKPDFTESDFKQLITPLVNNEKEKIIFFTNHKRKDGSLYPAEIHLQLVADTNNKRFLAIVLDITERKKGEERLLEAFEEKNNILERITEAFVSLDSNWCYTYMNKKAGEIFNRDPEKLIGKHIWTEFPEGVNQSFHLAYERAMTTQQYVHVEEHYKPYDLWFENHIYPSADGLSIFFRDITERKKIEETLVKANERFLKVTEATNDAIWDWDIEKKVMHRSKAIESFFGEKVSKSFNESVFWKDSFHPDDLVKIQESVKAALADPACSRWELEYRVCNENGKILYIIDRGVIIRNSNGQAVRMVGAMTDISEQKQMTLQLSELNQSLKQHTLELERSNEELEQFAFVASHDLQEPLRMISSFMDLLERKYGEQLDEKGHQYIHFATDGAKRMKQIILDLLDYSKANKPKEGKEDVDMNELFFDFKQSRRKLISEKKAVITAENLPTLKTYKAAITQILHCILDNAIKYSEETSSPRIEINVEEKEEEWLFKVKDNGIGIDPQFYDKIFVIFQRLHNKDKFPGTGIGLSIAKRHVEFLGGQIWLESVPGEGSVFYFTIPKNNSTQ